MNSKLKTLVLAAAFILFVAGASFLYRLLSEKTENAEPPQSSSAPEGSAPSQPEKVAVPDFEVLDMDGKTVALSSLFGKPIVLNFWASWCPPCQGEMPEFDEVFLEKGEEVTFVMVDLVDGGRETVEKGKAFIEKSGYSFPVYFDTTGEAANAYGISSIPTTVFIDSEGYLVSGTKGQLSKKKLLEGIEKAMQQNQTAQDVVDTLAPPPNFNPSWCTMEPEYVKISTEDAKRLMGEFEEYTILDVRTQQEYDQGHIENAVLLPYDQINAGIETLIPDKKQVVFVYCRTGRRSEIAAKAMVELGYNHVFDFGGIVDWK